MSHLKISRILIIRGKDEVYNETFHDGVNIIRGHNSSGKSTVSNFIFFALGGEFISWIPEALACDFVYAEVQLNETTITLRREVSDQTRRPMDVFFGSIQDSQKSPIGGWVRFPYNRTDTIESFSQVLFKALDFPIISSDNQEAITINQVLRLLYIDQLSALDSLMRNEDFDSPTIRVAIGNLLLGTYNDKLLEKQMSLKSAKRQHAEIKSQLKAIEDIFKHSPFEFDASVIQNRIKEAESQLDKVYSALSDPNLGLSKIQNRDTQKRLSELQEDLIRLKKDYSRLKDNIHRKKLEVIDTEAFLEILNEKLEAIDASLQSRSFFGNLEISFCPICLERLHRIEADNHCQLCQAELSDPNNNSKLLRMKLEIETQVSESNQLQKFIHEEIAIGESSLKLLAKELDTAQRDLNTYLNQARTSNDQIYDRLLEQKGKLTAEVDFLNKQLQLIESYEAYKVQFEALSIRVGNLEAEIGILFNNQKTNAWKAYRKIEEYTLTLLRGDGEYEELFSSASKLEIDLAKNTFYLNGRNRFSASSMVLLKNCVRFAIFFASLELDYFRYPRFILCDNIEDKGMEEARSKNFQRNVVGLTKLERFKDKRYQIIFSTSMIAEELDIPEYTIGPFYDKNRKSLL